MPHMPARPVVASTTETWKKLSAVGATRPSADYMAEQVEKAGAQRGTRCNSTIMLSLQSQHMQKRKGLLPAIKNLSPDMPSPQGVYYAHTHAHALTQTHTHTHVRAQDKPCGGEHIHNQCINKAVRTILTVDSTAKIRHCRRRVLQRRRRRPTCSAIAYNVLLQAPHNVPHHRYQSSLYPPNNRKAPVANNRKAPGTPA